MLAYTNRHVGTPHYNTFSALRIGFYVNVSFSKAWDGKSEIVPPTFGNQSCLVGRLGRLFVVSVGGDASRRPSKLMLTFRSLGGL